MLTDEDLQKIAMLLESYGLKKITDRRKSQNAERQRRFRERNADSNAKVTLPRAKRNADSNAKVTLVVEGDQSHAGAVNGNAVAYIPIVGGSDWGVSKDLLAELEAAYPQVDGPQTLKEIRAWCITNPQKRKTARGIPRFLNRWFERVQNHG